MKPLSIDPFTLVIGRSQPPLIASEGHEPERSTDPLLKTTLSPDCGVGVQPRNSSRAHERKTR
eukprot:1161100-Prymnesium_polylepis.1